MPRLLYIMDYEPRGTRTRDHYILALTRLMHNRGWEVRYAFGANLPIEFGKALSEAGGTAVTIPFPFTPASASELVRKMGDYRPDVTQTSFLSAFTGPLLKLKRSGFTKRLIVIDHSSGEVPMRRGVIRLAARLRGWWVGRIVDAVLPVSEAIARRDVERVFLPAKKVHVVHNGIRLVLFPNPPRPLREVVRVVYAGQLIPEKGVLTLLRAHAILRKSGMTNYELLLAGKGPHEATLKDFCATNELNDVRFLGHIDSVPELFGSADIVVVPSEWYEAFGLVVAEAMACGAACLVSDAGALPEVAGDTGLVFKSGNVRDLADRLRELLSDRNLRDRLGRDGRKRVEALFSLEQMLNRHVSVCEDVYYQNGRRT